MSDDVAALLLALATYRRLFSARHQLRAERIEKIAD